MDSRRSCAAGAAVRLAAPGLAKLHTVTATVTPRTRPGPNARVSDPPPSTGRARGTPPGSTPYKGRFLGYHLFEIMVYLDGWLFLLFAFRIFKFIMVCLINSSDTTRYNI